VLVVGDGGRGRCHRWPGIEMGLGLGRGGAVSGGLQGLCGKI
jgi:hypothetical protein